MWMTSAIWAAGSANGNCDKDCQTRIVKASSVFGTLEDVWRNKHISSHTMANGLIHQKKSRKAKIELD